MTKSASKPFGIYFFTEHGKWGFLSPMYSCKLVIDKIVYNSAEHYHQSMKAANEKDRKWIREAASGYGAKERAHSLD